MSSIVISGDTSGAITLAAPAVAGTNTATLPAATGTVMVSGNMPTFSAWQSVAQTLSSNTSTKLTFTTEEWDTNNNFASSTFTPTVAGYYQITSAMVLGASNSNNYVMVYKNGSVYKFGGIFTLDRSQVTCLVYCNGTTDYIEIYGRVVTGQVLDATSSSGTYFQAAMIRSA